jgi:hypothetical protein
MMDQFTEDLKSAWMELGLPLKPSNAGISEEGVDQCATEMRETEMGAFLVRENLENTYRKRA